MSEVSLKIQRLNPKASIPEYATDEAGAMDLCACIDMTYTLLPNNRVAIPTGLAVEVPPTFGLFIFPRSGLALTHDVDVLNAPGLIDPDYRGEIKVLLRNNGTDPFHIKPGARIAQMAIIKLPDIAITVVESLSSTRRGTGGFGSTGH